MLSDLRVETAWWSAKLTDGTEWNERSPLLRRDDCSPWIAMERLGVPVESATICVGRWTLAQDAHGDRLVCGRSVDLLMDMNGAQASKAFAFLLRENAHRWIWTITDGVQWWEVVEPTGIPGREAMPSVAGVTPRGGRR